MAFISLPRSGGRRQVTRADGSSYGDEKAERVYAARPISARPACRQLLLWGALVKRRPPLICLRLKSSFLHFS